MRGILSLQGLGMGLDGGLCNVMTIGGRIARIDSRSEQVYHEAQA